jgi:hypothetical protein
MIRGLLAHLKASPDQATIASCVAHVHALTPANQLVAVALLSDLGHAPESPSLVRLVTSFLWEDASFRGMLEEANDCRARTPQAFRQMMARVVGSSPALLSVTAAAKTTPDSGSTQRCSFRHRLCLPIPSSRPWGRQVRQVPAPRMEMPVESMTTPRETSLLFRASGITQTPPVARSTVAPSFIPRLESADSDGTLAFTLRSLKWSLTMPITPLNDRPKASFTANRLQMVESLKVGSRPRLRTRGLSAYHCQSTSGPRKDDSMARLRRAAL